MSLLLIFNERNKCRWKNMHLVFQYLWGGNVFMEFQGGEKQRIHNSKATFTSNKGYHWSSKLWENSRVIKAIVTLGKGWIVERFDESIIVFHLQNFVLLTRRQVIPFHFEGPLEKAHIFYLTTLN